MLTEIKQLHNFPEFGKAIVNINLKILLMTFDCYLYEIIFDKSNYAYI